MWRVAKVVAHCDETSTARTLTRQVPGWPGHIAGQHVDVRVTAPDGYSAVRSYSIASAPNSQEKIELTIERLPNGEVSPYLTQVVTAGDRLEVRGPIGGWFVWRTGQTEPIQLIAGGSGIVPLMSMIRSRVFARSRSPFDCCIPCASPMRSSTGTNYGPCLMMGILSTSPLRTAERLPALGRGRSLARRSCTDLFRLSPHVFRGKRNHSSGNVRPREGHEQDRALRLDGRTKMSTVERDYLDGNAAAGELSGIFVMDVTTGEGPCAECGVKQRLADAHVYMNCPGLVARCSACGHVLLRMASVRQRVVLDMRGMTYLNLRSAEDLHGAG
jgi:Family of unknown function (DUF6510)/Oxidoreductase FAD-binding domain